MKIRLDAWLKREFDPPPHIATARTWVKQGKIWPPPVKVGRAQGDDQRISDDCLDFLELFCIRFSCVGPAVHVVLR
ncbi:excisionase [Caballeronia sp. dw_19]|uniref:excisionase n=1 Tax=Caballeronia sp. dw_19 TaxID=2719791 RepID=UPI001BD25366|nr:excisionase [Caballeronia sp. dw_19]